MKVDLTALSLRLNAGGTLKLRDARGLTIRAARGVLWITQEGDEKDHIIGIAEHFVVTHDGLTVVQAVTQAELCMQTEAVAEPENQPARALDRQPASAPSRDLPVDALQLVPGKA